MSEIRVDGLCKAFGGAAVLENVSFTAGPGVTCVMAPSGEGKTTLLRILLGLERADRGAVSGLEGARLSAVFQEDRLLPRRTVWDNLRFVSPGLSRPRAAALLAELGLAAEVLDQRAEALSGGMRRRAALARALSVPFDVLVLDEPFAGLDRENRDRCLCCIRGRTAGKTVLLVTHDETDAAGLDARIVRLDGPAG